MYNTFMKVIFEKENTIVVRIMRGEEVMSTLLSFLHKRNISGGWIGGLGACDMAEISYYDIQNQKYMTRVFEQDFEITNLSGNIAVSENKTVIHAHITLAKKDYTTIGGHLHTARISGTGEIRITVFDTTLTRSKDTETGLTLLD